MRTPESGAGAPIRALYLTYVLIRLLLLRRRGFKGTKSIMLLLSLISPSRRARSFAMSPSSAFSVSQLGMPQCFGLAASIQPDWRAGFYVAHSSRVFRSPYVSSIDQLNRQLNACVAFSGSRFVLRPLCLSAPKQNLQTLSNEGSNGTAVLKAEPAIYPFRA
jgi:hypothetical protein